MGILGSLVFDLQVNARPFDAGLNLARRQLGGFNSSLVRVSSLASSALSGIAFGAVAAGTAAVGAGLFKAISSASNLGETVSKVNEVFGAQAGVVTSAADDMAAKYGTVKQSFLDAASGIGLIAKGSGLGEKAAADLGVELARLGDDASSFYNSNFDEALQKIRSGLVGEAEPLRAYGVLLSETAVQAEALRLGLAKTAKGITESAKVQARASLIRKGLSTAQGDRERTKDSPANRQREIAGRTTNALTDVGTAVQPIWKELLAQVNVVGQGIGDFVTRNKGKIADWAKGVVADIRAVIAGAKDLYGSFQVFLGTQSGALIRGGVGDGLTWLRATAIDVFDTVGFAMRNWDAIAQIAGIQIVQVFQDVGTTIGWMGTVVGTFVNWFAENWTSILGDALTLSLSLFSSWGNMVKGQFEQIKGFLSDPLHFEIDWSKFNPVANFRRIVDDLGKVKLRTAPLVIPGLELDHRESDRQIAGINEGVAERERKHAEEVARRNKGGAETEEDKKKKKGEEEAAAAKAAGSKNVFADAPSWIKSLQQGALSGMDQKQVAATTGNTKATEDATAVEKEANALRRKAIDLIQAGKPMGGGPVVAMGPAI
jgi:hypothetical protein